MKINIAKDKLGRHEVDTNSSSMVKTLSFGTKRTNGASLNDGIKCMLQHK